MDKFTQNQVKLRNVKLESVEHKKESMQLAKALLMKLYDQQTKNGRPLSVSGSIALSMPALKGLFKKRDKGLLKVLVKDVITQIKGVNKDL